MSSATSPFDDRLRADVAAHLERLLADELFIASERTTRFLRYIVEQTLAGRAGEIKELVIAMELYGRTASYDPKRDSTVRVEASRVRDKLRRYYARGGEAHGVTITIPLGSYVPRFVRHTAPNAAPRERPSRRMRRPMWAAAALLAAVVCWQATPRAVPRSTLAAWHEGNALLELDPHTSNVSDGMPRTLARAIDRFETAVAVSPSFAPGWASLAEAYEYASAFRGRDAKGDADRAEHAATRAVAIEPGLAQAHAMLGLVRFYLRWDFRGAEAAYRRAIELDPRAAWTIVEFADLLSETGRLDDALALIRRARELQPALPILAVKDAELLVLRGRAEDAAASAQAALDLKRDSSRALVALGAAHESLGDTAQAAVAYRRALDLDPRDRRALPALGHLLGRLGQRDEARDLLDRLETLDRRVRGCAFQIAVVHAGLGERDVALDWLERAYTARQMHVPFMVVEPRLRGLRSSPRFRALAQRLGLPIQGSFER